MNDEKPASGRKKQPEADPGHAASALDAKTEEYDGALDDHSDAKHVGENPSSAKADQGLDTSNKNPKEYGNTASIVPSSTTKKDTTIAEDEEAPRSSSSRRAFPGVSTTEPGAYAFLGPGHVPGQDDTTTASPRNPEDSNPVVAEESLPQDESPPTLEAYAVEDQTIVEAVPAPGIKKIYKAMAGGILVIIVVVVVLVMVVFRPVEIKEADLPPTEAPTVSPTPAPTEFTIVHCSPYTFVGSEDEIEAAWEAFDIIADLLYNDGMISVNSTTHEEAWELCSPQKKSLFNMAILASSGASAAFSDLATRYALGVFFFALGGEEWEDNTGWLVGTDVCDGSWVGIECASFLLTALELDYNGLAGSLPTELALLSSLEEILLYSNAIGGSIPSQIGEIRTLEYIDWDDNALVGSLPSEIGNLNRMDELLFAHNHLTGVLPSELGSLTWLKYFSLWDNALEGTIPSEFGLLENLVAIDLSENMLQGEIPSSLGSLQRLTMLFLEINRLSGSIPSYIGGFPRLIYLYLHQNELIGTIPSELGQLSDLLGISLSYNFLSGQVPSEIGRLSSLENIYLAFNSLSGPIPSELYWLPRLKSLVLSGNLLTGLPVNWTGAISLQDLMLAYNPLNSTIPENIALESSRLRQLDLFNTSISGTLPRGLSSLSGLIFFSVGSNQLSGVFPPDLPPSIVFLDLSDNLFNSTIPTTIGTYRRLETLDVSGNADLSGTLPTELANVESLRAILIDDTSLSGMVPEELCDRVDANVLNMTVDCEAVSCSCCDCGGGGGGGGVLLLR